MHEGHRQRMLERLKKAEDGFEPHELLEVLLYNAIPRKNTNEIAHRLLAAFGSLGGVLNAGIDRLTAVEGVGESTAAYLRCVGLCLSAAREEERKDVPSAYRFDRFSQYLFERLKDEKEEVIELYGVDFQGHVRYQSRYTSKAKDRVSLPPDAVTRFLLACDSPGVIVVHNHLCRNANPSSSDDIFTEEVQMLCSIHNIELFDHIIISPVEIFSYHMTDRLEAIKKNYSVESVFRTKQRLAEENPE